jgi:menaquinone-9 beta-reductase
VVSPSHRVATFPLPRDRGQFAAVMRRTDLDAAIVNEARDAGAQVIEDAEVTGAADGPEHVRLTLADGSTVQAAHVIAADGMWSPMRKLLGTAVPGYLGEWHAFRQYFTNVSPAARDLWVWFEPDLLPGYVWSFPLPDGRANVGFGIQRDGRGKVGRVQDMNRLWPDLLARPHIRAVLGDTAEPESPHKAWPIPARIDRAVLAAGRSLFVGDAAAATDPLTGEGIGQALLTGVLAAEAVVGAGPSDAIRATAAYERTARAALVADHRMSEVLVSAMRHRKGARFAIRLAGFTPWTRRNFARWLFEDYPRAVVATPRRWHRGMFSSPGARFDGDSPVGNEAETIAP